MKTISVFFDGRNIDKAIYYAKKCKKYNDPVWHFNLAFLYAYDGDLKKSIQQYNICRKFDVFPKTLSEVEDFMVWILKEEPNKYQYYYLLGYFNWRIKGDGIQAVKDFEKFLELLKDNNFSIEKRLAKDWINTIQNG